MDLALKRVEKPQERIFSILFDNDELTWQNIIYELVRTEGMDPWDVDVSLMANKFLKMLKKLKEMDFRISGKVVLASAILLKLKSNKLIEEDINVLDNLISSADNPEELIDELPLEYPDELEEDAKEDKPKLKPRTPQPRKRKVSVFDLVKALEKALEVEQRRPAPAEPKANVKRPEKKIDISEVIKDVYGKVTSYYQENNKNTPKLSFNQLIPSDTKEDKVFTFIPLLHLENQRRVEMEQQDHFQEIFVSMLKARGIDTSKLNELAAK